MSTTTLDITHPAQMKKIAHLNGTDDISIGNFGHVPYGKSIEGRVVYIKKNRYGCDSFGDSLKKYGDAKIFVIIEKGKCAYVTKAKNVETAGGKLAIILEDKENDDMISTIMVNDGTQLGLKIPTILVDMNKGNKIKNYLKRHRSDDSLKIEVKVTFGLAQTSDHVEYDLIFDPSLKEMIDFISDFSKYHKKFKYSVTFTPRYYTWSCEECNKSILNFDCIVNGRYCSMNNDNLELNGKEVIDEIVRERCIWDSSIMRENWWNYIEKAHSDCNYKLDKECSQNLQSRLRINWIQNCVSSAEGALNDKSYKYSSLETEKEYFDKGKRYLLNPSVVINGDMYRGDINPDYVKEAICSAFVNKPDTCQRFLASQIVDQDNFEHKSEFVTQQVKIPTNEESLFWPLILGFLLLIAVFCILFKTKIFKKSKVTKEERIEVEELDISNHPCL